MKVLRLTGQHFRNLKLTEFCPGPGVNILYGNNGQGKTNLLEALWLFTGSRSFRRAKDRELINFHQKKATLSLDFEGHHRRQNACMEIQSRRLVTINGVEAQSSSRLAGHFCGIVFSPAHLWLIQGGPEERRRFIDGAYCQIRPGYIPIVLEYNRTLKQRNSLLRQMAAEGVKTDLLDTWDYKLSQAGAKVMLARAAYISRLRPMAVSMYSGISGGRETMALRYQPGIPGRLEAEHLPLPELEQALQQALYQTRDRDLKSGSTSVGPHRDDLLVEINGVSARLYGSQGQQRSAVLALKMAEASVLEQVIEEHPVAFLDDVMSELDESRQDYILNHIQGWQVFITCCEPTAVLRLANGDVFYIEQGRLSKES